MEFSVKVVDKYGYNVGELDNVNNIEWKTKYYEIGSAIIEVVITESNIEMLQVGHILVKDDDNDTLIIRSVKIDDKASKPTITAYATSALAMLEDRIVYGTEQISEAEADAFRVFDKNIRGLNIFAPYSKGLNAELDMQRSWVSVQELLLEITNLTDVAFRIYWDFTTRSFILESYMGVNRALEDDNRVGAFSDANESITDLSIIMEDLTYKNIAIVGGQGEGEERTIVEVQIEPAIPTEDRREVFIDARNESKLVESYDDEGNYSSVEMTDAEYLENLKTIGRDRLYSSMKVDEFVCALAKNDIVQYKEDFTLGDIVPVSIVKYNKYENIIINGITFTYDKSGYNIILEIGEPLNR